VSQLSQCRSGSSSARAAVRMTFPDSLTTIPEPFMGRLADAMTPAMPTTTQPRTDFLAAFADACAAVGVSWPELRAAVSDADLVAAVEAMAHYPDPTALLRTYVRAVLADADRALGHRTDDETVAALCRRCGPVWVTPRATAMVPTLAGWPRIVGCPWCRLHSRIAIPRPRVMCAMCRHYRPDRINPDGGMGHCAAVHSDGRAESSVWQHRARECSRFHPIEA
ncbi:hypothetical protein, partial [Lysobacter sp. CA199]|uniref:hypothetical protein n=1 Tax=Lysobacter sp. CA199 TaxID=3455608 RepID=UPI003F8D4455